MDVAREVLAAEARIRPYVRETPVEESRVLGAQAGAQVFLKLECYQLTGSFKLRGAVNKILSLGTEAPAVVAASSGNHGAAIAHAVAVLGGRGVVFVPEDASPTKIEAIRAAGAEVRQEGADCVIAERLARRYGEEHGIPYVSPYNDPLVVGGQGTIGLELARQLETIDTIYVALGGGGLTSGIAGYLESIGRDVEIVACSPERSAVMAASLEAGRILDLESKPTLSDGTAGGVEAGAITFELCRRLIDRTVLLSEAEIRDAMRLLIGRHHVLVEGAAAVAVAGFLREKERLAGRNVAIVLCGANVSPETLREIL
ncbi:MAG: threonine/serine dehydratase [bacterium]|nr:threonine/serine dehydratase [bacterium]